MIKVRTAIICAFALLTLFCTSLFAQPGQHSACTPQFPFEQQWQGGDVASSIPLPDGRVVWIFGDTLTGNDRLVIGDEPRMVRNSIAISTCKAGKWNIDYVMRRGKKEGEFVDFFPARKPDTWYWAIDGVYYNNELWLAGLCTRATKDSPQAALGFAFCGTDLARVSNLGADPQQWKIEYYELVPDGTQSYPSAATIIDGDHLYIFSLNEFGNRDQTVTRIPLSGLKAPKANLEYLAADGKWKKGFDPKDAKVVMTKGASELSVRYHPELKKWVAVMVDPTYLSDKIVVRSADSLLGPWSEGQEIHRIPAMQKDAQGYDPDTMCYAGKEHSQFEKPGRLVFTYVCNSLKPAKLMKLNNIYFPQVVDMEMPLKPAPQK